MIPINNTVSGMSVVNKCLLISTLAASATSALLLPVLFYFIKVIVEIPSGNYLVLKAEIFGDKLW